MKGVDLESQIVSEPVISSEYTDNKIYQNVPGMTLSSVKFGGEVEKIVVTNMSFDQTTKR